MLKLKDNLIVIIIRFSMYWKLLFSVISLSILFSCSNGNYAPIIDLRTPSKITHGSYIVKNGESLYSIAWKHGWDYRELAVVNNIRSPYIIYPGQKIKLAIVKHPIKTSKPKKKIKKHLKQSASTKAINWQWPTRGVIIEKFLGVDSGNKGIDIQAKFGAPVAASADGVVVYAGNGLIGYGNLLIIKHNSTYLSAYAHNNKLFKEEQETVQAGEKIAEIGSTGAKSNRLHFEIRKNGKPVNPLRYLPK